MSSRRIVIFAFQDFYLGGTEELILRSARAVARRGAEVCAVTFSCADDIGAQARAEGLDLHVVKGDYSAMGRAVRALGRGFDQAILVVYTYDEYLMYSALLENEGNFTILLYIAARYAVENYENTPETRLNDARTMAGLIRSGRALYMDSDTLAHAQGHYGIKLGEPDRKRAIAPLPFEVADLQPQEMERRAASRRSQFEVLAVARADFPFKGYLFELVDAVLRLRIKDPRFHVTVIAGAQAHERDYGRLRAHIGSRAGVTLLPGVTHEELDGYYRRACLYVGMGTTVLEAAGHGVPTMQVGTYTYDLRTCGMFPEHPLMVTSDGLPDAHDFSRQAMRLIEASDEAYVEECRQTRAAVERTYSSDAYAARLLDAADHTGPYDNRMALAYGHRKVDFNDNRYAQEHAGSDV